MKILILGSGGFLRIPRACCECKICKEAREKGAPYERLGQSLLIKDESILFDTPEDINTELNKYNIKKVNHIFFSHWHPDHTKGIRILEPLRYEKNDAPVNVYLTENLKKDFETRVPEIFFYEKQGYCKINIINNIKIGNLKIKPILLKNNFAYAFLIEEKQKKVVFCPCHCMGLPVTDELKNADLLIMNLGYFGKEEKSISGFEKDNLRIIKQLKPKKTILTHIEENWKKNYDDYCKLEKKYKEYDLKFAFDGMKIKL
jgi:phosphoribosyl 1,2-cyclic phosphate phosphodiesterase